MTPQFNASDWDQVLAGALTIPGAPNPAGSITRRDGGAFIWGRWNAPQWSAERAFLNLGMRRIEFPEGLIDRLAGFATADGSIALNARTTQKVRTAAHEIAHVVLRHFDADDRAPIDEFEADCVALVVCHALQLGEAEQADCRHYIQHYIAQPCSGPLPTDWSRIKSAALKILNAGAGTFVVVPEPAPLAVEPVRQFAAKIRLGGSW